MTGRSINHRATNNRSSATNQFLLHPSANVTWRHFSAKITRTTESISTRGQIAGLHGLQLDSQHVTRDLHVAAKKKQRAFYKISGVGSRSTNEFYGILYQRLLRPIN